MDDRELRHAIYRSFADTGDPPDPAQLAEWAGGHRAADDALARLNEAHVVVLDADGTIRMAMPFSAVETGHTVKAVGEATVGKRWRANCAWDALAIPAALGIDASIDATCLDTGDPIALDVVDGELGHTSGFVHFEIPARRWWDDVVET